MADDTVNVKITATTEGLQQGMHQAAASVNTAAEQIKVSVGKAAIAFDQLGASAQAQIKAAMGNISTSVGSAMTNVATTVNAGAASTNEALKSMTVNTGEVREAFVLMHELIQGRFNRLAGSAMVMVERMGNLGSVVSFLTSPMGLLAEAAAAVAAALAYMAYQAYESEKAINTVHDSLTLMGRGLETSISDIRAFSQGLKDDLGASTSQARELTAAFARLPGFTLEEARAAAELALAYSRITDTKLDEAVKKITSAVNENGEAVLKLGKEWGINTDAVQENVKELDKSKETGAAVEMAIKALNAEVNKQVGAWEKATAAIKNWIWSFSGAVDILKQSEPGANVPITTPTGRPLGAQFHPEPDPNAQRTVDMARAREDMLAHMDDERHARIIRLRSEMEHFNNRTKAGLHERIALAKELGDLEYPEKTETAQAQREALIASAEHKEEMFHPKKQKDLTNKEYENFAEGERLKLEEARETGKSLDDIYKEWMAHAAAVYGEDSVQWKRVKLEKERSDKESWQHIIAEQEKSYSQQTQLDALYLKKYSLDQQTMVHEHQISKQQMYEADLKYATELHDQEAKMLQEMLSNDVLTGDQWNRLNMQKMASDMKLADFVAQTNEKIAADTDKTWKGIADKISDQMTNVIMSVVKGTDTIGQAFKKLFLDIVQDALKLQLKNIFETLLGGGSGSGGSGGGSGGGFLGNILGTLFGKDIGSLFGGSGGVLGMISGLFSGGGAGAGADAWMSAPGITLLEHGGVIPSAAGGWVIPSFADGGVLSKLHSGEMVLPRDLSQGMQSMIRGGGGAGGGTVNINAIDTQTGAQFLMRNGGAVAQAWRAGGLGGGLSPRSIASTGRYP